MLVSRPMKNGGRCPFSAYLRFSRFTNQTEGAQSCVIPRRSIPPFWLTISYNFINNLRKRRGTNDSRSVREKKWRIALLFQSRLFPRYMVVCTVNYTGSFPYLITRFASCHKYSSVIHPRPEFRNYVTRRGSRGAIKFSKTPGHV